MQLRRILQDDKAVSPVIGVILMVAITVILAAVIASFVLGLGDTDDLAPNPSFEYDYDGEGQLDISVTGGDSFTAGQVEITGDGDSAVSGASTPDTWNEFDDNAGEDSTIGAGATAELENLNDDFEIDIVWESADGESSSTIGGTEGPNA